MSEGDGEILMPHSATSTAAEQMQLVLLRQLIENVSLSNTKLEELNKGHSAISERLVRIEANRMDERVAENVRRNEALDARIVLLEAARQQSIGAQSFARWLRDYAPWLVAVVAALVLYFNKK